MRIALLTTLALTLPAAAAFAAGTSETPPTPTETTTVCTDGQIWDDATEACVTPKDARLDDATRYDAAREFAYAGQYDNALRVLEQLDDSAATLTLRGFATRKAGDLDGGMALYHAALTLDPDHWQARSYMGQALVEMGDSASARTQLTLIRTSGGRGTWAELSLRQAIARGAGYSY